MNSFQSLIGFVVLSLSGMLGDEIPVDLLAIIEKTRPKPVKVEPAKPTETPKPASTSKAKPAAPKKIVYDYRVKRIPRPAGYREVYHLSDSDSREQLLHHLKATHGDLLREVLQHVSIDSMSRRDILAIHSLIHCQEWGWMSPRDLGHWETQCPADPNLPCTQTFVWELP